MEDHRSYANMAERIVIQNLEKKEVKPHIEDLKKYAEMIEGMKRVILIPPEE